MFKISDDDFDDEFLDTEISYGNQPSGSRNILTECLVNTTKVNDDCVKPTLVSSTPAPKAFLPKLKKSPGFQVGIEKNLVATKYSNQCAPPKTVHNDLFVQDKLRSKRSEFNGPGENTPQPKVSSYNPLTDTSGRPFKGSKSINSLNNDINASNFCDAANSISEASNQKYSEFMAEWNDNDVFRPDTNDRLSKSRPNSERLPNRHTTETVSRKVNKSVRQRRFPGPAGLLPPRQGCTSLIAPEEFINELKSEENDPTYEENELLSQSSGSVFEGGAWSAMLDDLGPAGKSLLKSMNLASIKAIGRNLRSYKVPFLAVLVQSVDISLPDAAVGFKDPTGEMHGVVHRDVWDQFSSDITVGSVLVLRNVGIMSAGTSSSRQHVINITGRNLTAIYSPKDELNIQLRQIHEFAASNSSTLLEEWERVESQNSSASPLFSGNKNLPSLKAQFNNSPVGQRPPFRHTSASNTKSEQPRCNNSRPQHFNSPMHNNNPVPPRFNSSSPNTAFTPMPSRQSNQPPHLRNQNASNSPASVQNQKIQKPSCFAMKTPSSRVVNVPDRNHPDSNIPPAPNINNPHQQTPLRPTIPIKKPKVCQNAAPIPEKNTAKSNPFQVDVSSDVDSLLDGIDTDSLFGDF